MGLRGGGNFSIVTAIEFELCEHGPDVLAGENSMSHRWLMVLLSGGRRLVTMPVEVDEDEIAPIPPIHMMGEFSTVEPLRVVVADDHPFYRASLTQRLRESGIEIVAEVANGEAAILAAEDTAPDVVIMDLKMPGLLSGLEATRRLTAEAPASHVLVMSVSAEEDDVADALLAGASGYVLKDAPVEEVVAGVRAAAAGEALISPGIATALLRRLRDLARAGVDVVGVPLSALELEVLDLLADGNTDYEIAEKLAITLTAVRGHIASIVMKLQIEDRVQAAVLSFRKRRG